MFSRPEADTDPTLSPRWETKFSSLFSHGLATLATTNTQEMLRKSYEDMNSMGKMILNTNLPVGGEEKELGTLIFTG